MDDPVPFRLGPSPFSSSGRPRVHVVHGDNPYSNVRSALQTVGLGLARGKRVLLKPNAGRKAACGSGVTTHPQVVAAAIDAFREAGATVAVGESPITGVRTMEAFDVSGIAAVVRERDCELIDMDARPCVPCTLPEGKAIQALQVCREVTEFDLVVSIPVMKTHMHTGVTLAVKNMKGCLWRRSKVTLHMLPPMEDSRLKSLDVAVADMAWALCPHFSIIDGTFGMEGLGPSAGKAKNAGLVVVGADPFATDAVACRLMGLRAEEVPHLALGAERGYGVIDLARIDVTPAKWESWTSPFEPAPSNIAIDFPNIKVLDSQSCSACQSTLLVFLKLHGEAILDYFPKDHPVTIAIGKGHEDLPYGTLCIGNCTARHKDKGIFVPGCPPVSSSILKAVKREKDDATDT